MTVYALECVNGGPLDGEWRPVPAAGWLALSWGFYAQARCPAGGWVLRWCPLARPEGNPYAGDPMDFSDNEGWEG